MSAKLGASLALAALASIATASAHAQPSAAVSIGWLGSGAVDPGRQQAFERSLREQGIAAKLETRFAHARLERLPELAAELVRLNPEVILAADAVSTAAAKKATSSIPIVMAGASDPVGLGLVASLARPGGNVTGLASPFGDEFAAKWVELLRAVRPDARRFAVLWNPLIPAAKRRHQQVRQAAQAVGVQLSSLEVRSASEFDAAFAAYARSEAAGLIVDNAPFITANASRVIAFAASNRVPTVWGHAPLVRGGGLLSYGADYADIYRRAGMYVGKILKGARAAELPVEQPTKYELVINLATAKALGVTVPGELLLRADETIR